jgi:hypothetical protein
MLFLLLKLCTSLFILLSFFVEREKLPVNKPPLQNFMFSMISGWVLFIEIIEMHVSPLL